MTGSTGRQGPTGYTGPTGAFPLPPAIIPSLYIETLKIGNAGSIGPVSIPYSYSIQQANNIGTFSLNVLTTANVGSLTTTRDLNVGGNVQVDGTTTLTGTLQGQLGDFITLSAQGGAITSLNTSYLYSDILQNSNLITTSNFNASGTSYLSTIYSSTIYNSDLLTTSNLTVTGTFAVNTLAINEIDATFISTTRIDATTVDVFGALNVSSLGQVTFQGTPDEADYSTITFENRANTQILKTLSIETTGRIWLRNLGYSFVPKLKIFPGFGPTAVNPITNIFNYYETGAGQTNIFKYKSIMITMSLYWASLTNTATTSGHVYVFGGSNNFSVLPSAAILAYPIYSGYMIVPPSEGTAVNATTQEFPIFQGLHYLESDTFVKVVFIPDPGSGGLFYLTGYGGNIFSMWGLFG
jgi:hypothetical protein